MLKQSSFLVSVKNRLAVKSCH